MLYLSSVIKMTTVNWNSIGNYVLVILGATALYLTSINELKYAGFVSFLAIIVKGLLSEAQNQSDNSTPTSAPAPATAAPQTNAKYAKIRAYFVRHFWLY
jgi:hypothetical protein